MKPHSLFAHICGLGRHQTRRLRPRLPLRLEMLEDRWVPAVFNVNSTADLFAPAAGTATLRSAIQAANTTPGGNTINLTVAGLYQIAIPGANTGSDTSGAFAILPIGGDLIIRNTSGGAVTVDGNHLDRVFDINPRGGTDSASFIVTMQGFTIQNGLAQVGNGGSGNGGGIRDQGNANLVLSNMVLAGNVASADGGAVALGNGASAPWSLTLGNSTISFNRAGDDGGGVKTDGSGNLSVTNSVISTNTAANGGGGVWLDALGPGTINTPMITSAGGGYRMAPTVTFTGGGATTQATGVATILDNFGVVWSITLTNPGSGYTSPPTITFSGGGGSGAGAIATVNNFLSANLTVTDTLIQNNTVTATGFGGGIGNAGNGTVTLTDSTLSGNSVNESGGGFGDKNGLGTLNILNSSIVNNTATNGGGLFEDGPATTINDATVVGNVAQGAVGGIDVTSGAFTLNNNIVAGNFERSLNLNGTGVAAINVTSQGFHYASAPTVVITNAPGDTTGTGATAMAGLSFTIVPPVPVPIGFVSSVAVTNPGTGYTLPPIITLVGGGEGAAAVAVLSTPSPDIAAKVTSGSGNFIGIGTASLTGITTGTAGNQIGTLTSPLNPNLGPLQNNGGPTPTELPLPVSLVINTGVAAALPAGVLTDQRGFPRTISGAVDVGAVESQLTTTGANSSALGAYRPSDGSWSLDSNGTPGFQPGTPPTGDRLLTGFSPAGMSVLPVSGDWTGTGRTKIGDFENGTWHLDLNDNGTLDPGETFQFGQAGDTPVPGNYFGDGIRLAVFRAAPDGVSGEFVIADPNWRTEPVIGVAQTFIFGLATDKAVVGDWTGDGITKVGVFRDATAFGAPGAAVFSLDVTNAHAFVPGQSSVFVFGLVTDNVVVGDWDGSGTSKLGVYRPATAFGAPDTAVFSLDEHGDLNFGVDGNVFLFGLATDKYAAGKWAFVTAQTQPTAGDPARIPSDEPPLTTQQVAPVVQEAQARPDATGLDANLQEDAA